MRIQLNVARLELAAQTTNGTLQHGTAGHAKSQVTKSKTQELRIGVTSPVG
jgi:hypothetical protein